MRYPALVVVFFFMLHACHGAKDNPDSNIGRKRKNLINIGDVTSNDRVVIALEELLKADEDLGTIGRYLEYSSSLSLAITPSASPTDFPSVSPNGLPSASQGPTSMTDPTTTPGPTSVYSSSPSRPLFETPTNTPTADETGVPTHGLPTLSCPFIPEGGCSICGEKSCITNPDAIFSFQNQPEVACGDLQTAGQNGLIPLDACVLLPALVFDVCNCQQPDSTPTPSPELGTLSSAPSPSTSTLPFTSFEPSNTPTLMPIAPVFTCPVVPDGGCSICGKNSCITDPDAIFTFPNQPEVTCGDLQKAGQDGLIPLDQCELLSNFAFEVCNCQTPDSTPSPSPTSSTSSFAPSLSPITGIPASAPSSTPTLGTPSSAPTPLSILSIPSSSPSLSPVLGTPSSAPSPLPVLGTPSSAPSPLPELGTPSSAPSPLSAVGTPSSAPSPNTSSPTLLLSSESPSSFVTIAPSNTPTLMPIVPVFNCPVIPNVGCSLCGDGNCVADPNAIVSFPGQPQVACGELQKAAAEGLIPLDQCDSLSSFAFEICNCQPADPTPAPVFDGLCRPVPDGGCSICGENSCVFNPDAIFSFPGQPQVACGALQEAGYAGLIGSQCAQLPSLVFDICNCQEPDQASSGIVNQRISGRAAAPNDDIFLTPPETHINELFDLLKSVSLQGGEEFKSATSYQSKAMVWLSKHSGLDTMDDEQKIQRYALACIYFNTYSVTNPYTKEPYGAFETPGWTTSTNWLNPSVHECTWFGVECDSNHMVTSIDLSNNRLTGSFPPEVILLKESLIRLDISDNIVWNEGYEGNAFLGEVTKLEYLNYGSTKFQYNDGIPIHIGMLTSLVEYNCSYTLYRGALKGDVFTNLSQLNYLAIGGNSYNSSVPMELEQGFLPNLEYLYLDHADLTGDVSFLADLSPAMKELWLDMNPRLTGSLPSTLDMPHLKTLSMSHCGLTGSLPTEVGSMTELQHMLLNDNHLTGIIPTELGNLVHLRTLKLEDNVQSGVMPMEVCAHRRPSSSSFSWLSSSSSSSRSSDGGVLDIVSTDCHRVTCSCCTSCGTGGHDDLSSKNVTHIVVPTLD